MCVLLHLLICTALRAHIIVAEALYKINYYYYYYKTSANQTRFDSLDALILLNVWALPCLVM